MQWQKVGDTEDCVALHMVAVVKAVVQAAWIVVGRQPRTPPQGVARGPATGTSMTDRIDYVETYKCILQMMSLHLCVSAHIASTDR